MVAKQAPTVQDLQRFWHEAQVGGVPLAHLVSVQPAERLAA
jgi:hypothetical protein